MTKRWFALAALIWSGTAAAQNAAPILLKPAAVFDGVDGTTHPGWQVLVRGDRIVAVGPVLDMPAGEGHRPA